METAAPLPRHARGKRPQMLATPGMDQALHMILTLAAELSMVRERLDTLERVAAQRGLDLAAGIEAFEPDEAALAWRERERQALLARLYRPALKEASDLGAGDDEERFRSTIAAIAEGRID